MNRIAFQLKENLEKVTISNSNYEKQREYISLSHISECPTKIYSDFKNGYSQPDIFGLLKCYKGYQEEQDIKRRLKVCYPGYIETKEISIYNGLFKGHTDGELMGCLIEIKSFAKNEYIPQSYEKISYRIKCQIQAYMIYGCYSTCYLIMESRESGMITVLEVMKDEKLMEIILKKMEILLKASENNKVPICICGKCQ
jgi:hypothetical protein